VNKTEIFIQKKEETKKYNQRKSLSKKIGEEKIFPSWFHSFDVDHKSVQLIVK
jgi:hypothetical protein